MEITLDVLKYIFNNSNRIWEYTANHFSLALMVLIFSLILWISLGLIISKYEGLAGNLCRYSKMIIAGAVVVSIIALILDFIMGLIEKKVTSPGMRHFNQDQ